MKYRQLGNSDLKVSEIAFGTWLTFGLGIDKGTARACIRQAFDEGINFFDTANVYGGGAAEKALGKILRDYSRDSYVLATKLYFPMSDTDRGLSREQVLKQIDGSLQRLGVDYVDLYQCHRYDEDTPLEETMAALSEVVAAGKARYIGFSEWSPAQIRAALQVPGVTGFVSSQPQYSMLWRQPEAEVMPLCSKNGISQIVWSPLAQGVLTGKYEADAPPPADSRAASESMGGFMGRWLDPVVLAAVQELKGLAARWHVSVAQLALAWVLRERNVAAAIIGASRPAQVTDNAQASTVELDHTQLRAIDEALAPALHSLEK